jgi:hypothetical protein
MTPSDTMPTKTTSETNHPSLDDEIFLPAAQTMYEEG